MTEDVKAREGSNPLWHMSAKEQIIKVAGFVQKLHKNAKLVQIVQAIEHKASNPHLVCSGSTIPNKGRSARLAIPVLACKQVQASASLNQTNQ